MTDSASHDRLLEQLEAHARLHSKLGRPADEHWDLVHEGRGLREYILNDDAGYNDWLKRASAVVTPPP